MRTNTRDVFNLDDTSPCFPVYRVTLTSSSRLNSSLDSPSYSTSFPLVARTAPVPPAPPTAAPIAAPLPPPAIAPIAAPTPAPPAIIPASRFFDPSASAAWVFVEMATVFPFTVALVSARLILALPETRPDPSAATTFPSTFDPPSITVLPFTTTGSARLPVNVSPALFLPEFSAVDRTTVRDVPAGIVTVFGAGALGAAGAAGTEAWGLSAAVSAEAGAFESAEASSDGVAVSVSDALAQAPATARISSNETTFQIRMLDTLLLLIDVNGSTSNTGSCVQKGLRVCSMALSSTRLSLLFPRWVRSGEPLKYWWQAS